MSVFSSLVDMSISSTGAVPITISTFYDYDPVYGILVAAAVIFGLQSLILTVQSLRSRTWFLLWLVVFTACEFGGYVSFAIFDHSPTLSSYLGQLIMIILAPNFVTLVNYVVISRVLPWAGFEPKSLLARRGNLVPAFFLSSDLLCLTLQSIGGSQLSGAHHNGQLDEHKYDLGKNFNLVGISLQLMFQSVFALLAIYIYVNMPDRAVKRELRWTWLCMLITMVLVSMRNIYRIVEFAGGQHSAIDQTQVPYMVLDLLLMLLTGLTFIVLDLGSDWVLPARIRKAALLETAAQIHNDGRSVSKEADKDRVTIVEMTNAKTDEQPIQTSRSEDSV